MPLPVAHTTCAKVGYGDQETMQGFRSYQQFRNEVLKRSGSGLQSPIEDMADEMFQMEVSEEFDSMWDKHDDDE